jgi:hypothetical protein
MGQDLVVKTCRQGLDLSPQMNGPWSVHLSLFSLTMNSEQTENLKRIIQVLNHDLLRTSMNSKPSHKFSY